MEIAEKGAKDLHLPTEDSLELHKLTQGVSSGSESKSREAKHKKGPNCFRCGGRHLATKCRFISEECYSCGKQGHIAKVCRSVPGKHSDTNPEPSASTKELTNYLKSWLTQSIHCFQCWVVTVNHYRPQCWWKDTHLQWK